MELVIGFFNHQVDSEKGDPRAEWSVSQVLQVIRSKLLQNLMPLFSIAVCDNLKKFPIGNLASDWHFAKMAKQEPLLRLKI